MTANNKATKTSMLDDSIEPTPGPAGAETMKAIVQTAYGSSPERVLRLTEIDPPVIGDHEVLVRVRAASVDRGTGHLMTGLPTSCGSWVLGSAGPRPPTRAGAWRAPSRPSAGT